MREREREFHFLILLLIQAVLNYYLHFFIPPELHAYGEKINALVICYNIKVHYLFSTDKGQPMNEQRLDLNWGDTYRHIKAHYH